MTREQYALIAIAIMSAVTFLLRLLPFLVFRKDNTPRYINYLARVLPFAIMAMLVVFCLKDISFIASPYGIPELLAVIIVAALHVWRRNTLLSIIGGTAFYMLVQYFLL